MGICKPKLIQEKCFYCGRQLRANAPNKCFPETMSKDHIIPKSQGGNNHAANKVKACIECNVTKGSLSLDEFRVVMMLRKGLLVLQVKPLFAGEKDHIHKHGKVGSKYGKQS